MCCFSGPVKDVSGTKIFARLEGNSQLVAYAMDFSAAEDLAMILPVPTPAGSKEDAVEFVDLEKYPELFDHLAALMDPPTRGMTKNAGPQPGGKALAVHSVGAFEASFVPSPADMDRLDPRFKFPAGALEVLTRKKTREELGLSEAEWKLLPDYRDWGFCVFKLKQGERRHAHPMAFKFPTRWTDKLFFPTVHVHDGKWTPKAGFDHNLYLQCGKRAIDPAQLDPWKESHALARTHVKLEQAKGLVSGEEHVFRRALTGQLANQDTLVAFE